MLLLLYRLFLMQHCYRHPQRETAVCCSSCEKPICPDCMTPTSVGMRCPDCAQQRTKVRTLKRQSSGAPVTLSLIGICIAVFAFEFFTGSSGIQGAGGSMIGSGALRAAPVADGEIWRIVTSGFLHAGFLHLFFNLFALYVLGELLESAVGSLRFALIAALSLLVGSFGVLLLSPNVNTVGASGMVFGLLGASVLTARRIGIDPMQSGLGAMLFLNLGITFFLPGISIGGHLGGLAGGLLAAFLLIETPYYRPRMSRNLLTAAVVLLLPLFAYGCFVIAG